MAMIARVRSLLRRKSGQDATWLLGGGIFRAVVALATNLVLVRFITPDGYGSFAVAAATLGVVGVLLSLRINILIIRTPEEEYRTVRLRLLRAATTETILLIALMLGYVIAFSELSLALTLLIFGTSIARWAAYQRADYERHMHYGRLTRLESAAFLACNVVVVGLAVAGAGALALYVREVLSAVFLLAALVSVRAVDWRGLRWLPFQHWRWVLRDSAAVWTDGVVATLADKSRALAVNHVAGTAAAGLFAQAFRIATLLPQLMQPLTARLALNWYSRDATPLARRRRRRNLFLLTTLPSILGAIVVAAVADFLVPWLFGERWRGAVIYTQCLAGFMALAPLCATDRMLLLAMKGERRLLFARISQFAVFLAPIGLAWVSDYAPTAVHLALSWSASYAVCEFVQWRSLNNWKQSPIEPSG